MKQTFKIFVIVLLFNIFYSYNGALYAEELNRAKQIGIGTNFSRLSGVQGIELRYWFNDDYALQVGTNYDRSYGGGIEKSSHSSYGGSITNILVLKKKNMLRFLGLIGINYTNNYRRYSDSVSIYDSYSASLDFGVGAEYSFQEFPDLSFGAFVSGVGFSYSEEKYSTNSTFYSNERSDILKGFTTSTNTILAVKYYF